MDFSLCLCTNGTFKSFWRKWLHQLQIFYSCKISSSKILSNNNCFTYRGFLFYSQNWFLEQNFPAFQIKRDFKNSHNDSSSSFLSLLFFALFKDKYQTPVIIALLCLFYFINFNLPKRKSKEEFPSWSTDKRFQFFLLKNSQCNLQFKIVNYFHGKQFAGWNLVATIIFERRGDYFLILN